MYIKFWIFLLLSFFWAVDASSVNLNAISLTVKVKIFWLHNLFLICKDVGVGSGMPPLFALPTFGPKQMDSELSTSMTVVSGSLEVMEGLYLYGFKDPPYSVLHCRLRSAESLLQFSRIAEAGED